MKPKVLNITTSLFGGNGNSSQLNSEVIEHLRRSCGEVEVIHRDLISKPLPYFDAEFIGALTTEEGARSKHQADRVELADKLIAELKQSDIVIVAAPMYNFGVPAQLKTWIDYVARAGETFRYTSEGPQGLVADKPVYITTTRGGIHKGQESDSETRYLVTIFNFLGLQDLRFVYAEGLNMGQKEESFAKARESIQQWVQEHA